jgi:hypothetical protein
MKPKFLFLLFLMIAALSACSPGAVPTLTVVETVVVTQIVEGEAVEVIVTATPEPLIIPRQQATQQATQLIPDSQVVAINDEPGNPGQLAVVSPASRMVIKDAEMELLVRDTDQSLANVTQMAVDYGGYIISSQSWYDGDYKYATMRLAVPSASFEIALNNLRLLGLKMLRETASGQDVGSEYVDLQTRLANLEATAARVRAFLDEAKTVEESLKVNNQLSGLEGQIEQIKGQMGYFEGRTAFSTVTVFLTPERPTPTPTPTPTATPGWNPGETFTKASGTLITFSQSTVDFLIWFGVVLGPFLLILVVLLWSWRASRRRVPKHTPEP